MAWQASKWGRFFSNPENTVLEMLIKVIDRLASEHPGWLERDTIARALKDEMRTKNAEAYGSLREADYQNMVDWLSARYTELSRLRPILRQLEAFLDNNEQRRIKKHLAYRPRRSA